MPTPERRPRVLIGWITLGPMVTALAPGRGQVHVFGVESRRR